MTRDFKLVLVALTAFGASLPAFGGISYTCAADVDGTAAGTCAYLNSTIAGLYSSAFSASSIPNVNILIQFGTTGLGESTSGNYNLVPYSTYATALANAGGTGAVRASALSSLTNAAAAYSGDNVDITSAWLRLLELPRLRQVGVGAMQRRRGHRRPQ